MISPSDFWTIRYETPAEGVARVVMARPEVRNAQNMRMTYELNSAFNLAEGDPSVNVIILAAEGPHFSGGHDLNEQFDEQFDRVNPWGNTSNGGAERRFADEMEVFFGMCERWRNLSKPTIALVQGKCVSGGLMLAWVCDLILASDDASFKDSLNDMGVMGSEYFMHPWDLGVRGAKEFLFTTEWLPAERAMALGMLNRVVARDDLWVEGLALAQKIAAKPTFAVRTAKLAVNNAQDLMGRLHSMRHSFALHHLTHADCELKFGMQLDPQFARSEAGSRIKNFDDRIADWNARAKDWMAAPEKGAS